MLTVTQWSLVMSYLKGNRTKSGDIDKLDTSKLKFLYRWQIIFDFRFQTYLFVPNIIVMRFLPYFTSKQIISCLFFKFVSQPLLAFELACPGRSLRLILVLTVYNRDVQTEGGKKWIWGLNIQFWKIQKNRKSYHRTRIVRFTILWLSVV